MAYVLTTFIVMGFGYYVAETSLGRQLPLPRLAWVGLCARGPRLRDGGVDDLLRQRNGSLHVLSAAHRQPVLLHRPRACRGRAPGSGADYALAMVDFKRANPGVPVPLAMFATVANAVMWLWTTVGVAAELLFQVIPAALGWTETVDVGLSRTLFSVTLHAIVYFWLVPAYIAFYTMAPQAAGGRLYSDTMGRLTFILFLIYSLPVGMHHLFMDPQQSTGFKFLQMLSTALVAAPTLLTVFTITASMEIAGRLRGGTRAFRLDRGLALGPADGAGDRSGVLHAVVRRRRRADQHVLWDERDGSQHLVGHGAFPPDLRRHGGHHVFRDRL